jgi:alanine racemase
MVMNPSVDSFQVIMNHGLEPEIYGFKLLKEFIHFLGGRTSKIHIKIDTGMHRLGFDPTELEQLIEILNRNTNLKVESIFSHLAGSDDSTHDNYSIKQVEAFQRCVERFEVALGYHSILHVLNTPGILRFPQFQMDMVRLGVGLYGVDPTPERNSLRQVATLKTVVSQIREIGLNETIGYGRKGHVQRSTKVATIAIGYADGFSRAFSDGIGEVSINGQRAPIIGNVCMDMSMVDVTGMDVNEGDEVVIFGKELPLHEVAKKINTIPYEILTNTSERVKRVFVAESL